MNTNAHEPSSQFFNSSRKFGKEKIQLINFIEILLGLFLLDINIQERALFLVLEREDYANLKEKMDISILLSILLGKRVFFIPSKGTLKYLVDSIFSHEAVKDINIRDEKDVILIKILLHRSLNRAFFKHYKPIFKDITNFLILTRKSGVKLIIL